MEKGKINILTLVYFYIFPLFSNQSIIAILLK